MKRRRLEPIMKIILTVLQYRLVNHIKETSSAFSFKSKLVMLCCCHALCLAQHISLQHGTFLWFQVHFPIADHIHPTRLGGGRRSLGQLWFSYCSLIQSEYCIFSSKDKTTSFELL